MTRKDPYTVRPYEIQPGDVYLLTLKVMIAHDGEVRFYKCPYPVDIKVPEGIRVYLDDEALRQLMPTIAIACESDDDN